MLLAPPATVAKRPAEFVAPPLIVAPLPEVESAEPNGWVGLSAPVPGFHPTDIGFGALLWEVNVLWDEGELCPFGLICECATTYQFIIEEDGATTLLSVDTYAMNPVEPSDCVDVPVR